MTIHVTCPTCGAIAEVKVSILGPPRHRYGYVNESVIRRMCADGAEVKKPLWVWQDMVVPGSNERDSGRDRAGVPYSPAVISANPRASDTGRSGRKI